MASTTRSSQAATSVSSASGGGDGDAEVRFNKPRSGAYDIWIGSFNGGMASTTLLITETP